MLEQHSLKLLNFIFRPCATLQGHSANKIFAKRTFGYFLLALECSSAISSVHCRIYLNAKLGVHLCTTYWRTAKIAKSRIKLRDLTEIWTYATFRRAFSTSDFGFNNLDRASWLGETGLWAKDVSKFPFNNSNVVTFPLISE